MKNPPPITSRWLVERGLRRGGSAEALVDGRRRVSFSALADRSARLANCLLHVGASARRPVAALMTNRSEYIEVDVAATRAGVPRVGLGERLSVDEWLYILADSGATVLVASAELAERLIELPDTVQTVIVVGEDESVVQRPGVRTLHYETALLDASAIVPPAGRVDPDDPNYILYTSGTTGRPKGAWHSHRSRAAAALNMLAFELTATAGSAMAHVGPLTHGSGSKVLAFIAVGARNIVLDRFDPETLARAVADEGATHVFMVPTMLHRLIEQPPQLLEVLRRLERVSFGGSPIAVSTFESAIDRLGPVLVQVYGSCEAPHPVTLLRPEDYAGAPTEELLSSAGYSSPVVEVRVVDDGCAPVAPGEVGELQVRGPHLMTGYWNNEAATRESFVDGRWYVTGDLASMSESGLVTFRDRKHDLIISGGFNIYPSEVERVLLDHPRVSQAVVVGYPDDEWGESVLAYVVAEGNGSLTADELTAWTKDRLAGYKKPRAYKFLSELPLGSSHKVLRQALRHEHLHGRASAIG